MKLLLIVTLGAVMLLAASACGRSLAFKHIDQFTKESEKFSINQYVDCVDSRFPLRANRSAYTVTADAVAEEILDGRLDFRGMATTYSSLGCGTLYTSEEAE